jgi:hypothetical protein
MSLFKRSPTQKLTGYSFELTTDRRLRNGLIALFVVVVLVAVGGVGIQYFEEHLAPAVRIPELERENARLKVETDRMRVELEMERATHVELRRQVDELNDKIVQLTNQLGFFNSQANGAKGGR